jgi:hypothetical protein
MVEFQINPGAVGTPWGRRQRQLRVDKCLFWQLDQSIKSGKQLPPHLMCENQCGASTGRNGREVVLRPGATDAHSLCLFQFYSPEGVTVITQPKEK